MSNNRSPYRLEEKLMHRFLSVTLEQDNEGRANVRDIFALSVKLGKRHSFESLSIERRTPDMQELIAAGCYTNVLGCEHEWFYPEFMQREDGTITPDMFKEKLSLVKSWVNGRIANIQGTYKSGLELVNNANRGWLKGPSDTLIFADDPVFPEIVAEHNLLK